MVVTNMNILEISKKTLIRIVIDETPFALATRNAFREFKVEPIDKNNINAILGCELRHQLLLDNLIERYFDKVDFEKTIYLRFLIANQLFLRRFSNDELYVKATQDLDKEKIDALLEFVKSTNEIIPNELDKSSPEFLALRFNTPAWVIRMWQKQYGKGVVFKVLKTNYHQSVPTIRVNERLISSDAVLSKYPDFAKSLVENVLIYQGKGTPKNLEEFKTNKIFFMKMATKYVLDRLEIEPIKGIAIYSDVPNNIYLDLVARFGDKVAADIIIHHTQSYYETKKNIEHHGYTGLSTYNANSSSIITCISKKVDTMICLPKNSTFDLLRSTPDYFLRVKQEKLDEIIEGEYQTLEESARVVEVDGRLVYMIPTISKKESSMMIANFLFHHPEFELVEEKQFFPFEAFDSCLYYAILRKTGEPSD